MPDTERRKYSRVTFDAPAKLDMPSGASCDTDVHDLSLKGVLLVVDKDISMESGDFTLNIQLDADVSIKMQLSLSHQEKEHAGFLCHHIDLDSMTHLRRLVELNMGNSNLLDRELNQLVQ